MEGEEERWQNWKEEGVVMQERERKEGREAENERAGGCQKVELKNGV